MSQTSFPWLADVTQAAVSVPAVVAGALAALLVLLCVVEVARARTGSWTGGLIRIVLGVIVSAGVVALLFQNGVRELADTRRALEARLSDISTRAMMPGSPLGCLAVDAGDAVDNACEKAVFASAASVAAAVAYVDARLSLLEDARRLAPDRVLAGMHAMVELRRSLERDPFGIAAHLLTVRHGCTAVRCDAFALFTDAGILQVNLRGRVFEGYVRRHADDWKDGAAAVAKATEKTPDTAPGERPADDANASQAGAQSRTQSGTPGHMPTKFDFPSAASIPPVSIMNPEPKAAPAPNGAGGDAPAGAAPPVPPKRPPSAVPAPQQ
jgi:hypothetical protein